MKLYISGRALAPLQVLKDFFKNNDQKKNANSKCLKSEALGWGV